MSFWDLKKLQFEAFKLGEVGKLPRKVSAWPNKPWYHQPQFELVIVCSEMMLNFKKVISISTIYLHFEVVFIARYLTILLVFFSTGKVFQAAFWYGLIVHFRVYPIIYSLPFVLVLSKLNIDPSGRTVLVQWSSQQNSLYKSSTKIAVKPSSCWMATWCFLRSIITRHTILFGLFSGAVFFFWTALFFHLYGWDFLNEALLYHLTRTDPRHNFSIYFYYIYLNHQLGFSTLEKLISFLPQLMVQFALIWRFGLDLPFCLFLQTVAFVAFNKVSI